MPRNDFRRHEIAFPRESLPRRLTHPSIRSNFFVGSSHRVQAASKVSTTTASYLIGSIPPPRPSLTLALAVESSWQCNVVKRRILLSCPCLHVRSLPCLRLSAPLPLPPSKLGSRCAPSRCHHRGVSVASSSTEVFDALRRYAVRLPGVFGPFDVSMQSQRHALEPGLRHVHRNTGGTSPAQLRPRVFATPRRFLPLLPSGLVSCRFRPWASILRRFLPNRSPVDLSASSVLLAVPPLARPGFEDVSIGWTRCRHSACLALVTLAPPLVVLPFEVLPPRPCPALPPGSSLGLLRFRPSDTRAHCWTHASSVRFSSCSSEFHRSEELARALTRLSQPTFVFCGSCLPPWGPYRVPVSDRLAVVRVRARLPVDAISTSPSGHRSEKHTEHTVPVILHGI